MPDLSLPIKIVGSGPNSLTAAALLAKKGMPVEVIEAATTIGGGCRTEPLTLPGFTHDVCSTIHPMGVSSPAFRSLSLIDEGLEWLHSDIPLAHPLNDGKCAFLHRDLASSAVGLGRDGQSYIQLLRPFVDSWKELLEDVFESPHLPHHPFLLTRFGLLALKSAKGLADAYFETVETKALFAGMAAHAMLPLDKQATATFGLLLCASLHSVGWPLAKGGSQSIPKALINIIERHSGKIETARKIESVDDLGKLGLLLLTMNPKQLLSFNQGRLPGRYINELKKFRYGTGVCKIDWALSEPIPWSAEPCRNALTVHVGGTFEEIAASEKAANNGIHSEKPYVIVVQPTLVDPDRAPYGKHVGWAYCHVPNGSTMDMTKAIESQIERYAPGFSDCILGRNARTAAEMEIYNPCYVGGDIGAGKQTLRQMFARPVKALNPYRLPVDGWYLCSASTPPGGGVHGMCGYNAAMHLLEDLEAGR